MQHTMAGHVPAIALDTSTLDPDEQFAGWAGHSRFSVLSPRDGGCFLARGSVWDMGPVLVSQSVLDPFVSDRSGHMAAADGADHVQFVLIQRGSVRLEAAGIDQECPAPAIFVRDYRQASRVTASRIECLLVYLVRAFLEQAGGGDIVQGLLPATPEAAVFATVLRTMIENLPAANPATVALHARALRDLAAAALPRAPGRPPRQEQGRMARVKAHIARQPPGSVSVAALVRQLGVSRSVLYSMFAGQGGVMAYDRHRRLQALYRDLADPGQMAPIAALGANHGFLDGSSLVRSFRNTFGCTPGEARAARDEGGKHHADAASAIRHRIERLR